MVTKKEFELKGLGLKDEFFRDEDLAGHLIKDQKNQRNQLEVLKSVSGIEDRYILDLAVGLGINEYTFAAFGLVPLIKVAWADHFVHKNESKIILKFADQAGVEKGSLAFILLEEWLTKEINPNLFEAWKAYVQALKETLKEEEYQSIKDEIMKRSQKVAKSAGGFLGIGSISKLEGDCLKDIEKALS